jgi:DNA-binding transcriptional regulator YhcF (GntR family)
MDIISSGEPIYSHITGQIKNKIITGDLKAGEALLPVAAIAFTVISCFISCKIIYNKEI